MTLLVRYRDTVDVPAIQGCIDRSSLGEADSMSIPACIGCRSNIGDADTVSPYAGILCMQKQFRQRRFRVCHDNTGIPHSHICNYNASAEICACKPMGCPQTISYMSEVRRSFITTTVREESQVTPQGRHRYGSNLRPTASSSMPLQTWTRHP